MLAIARLTKIEAAASSISKLLRWRWACAINAPESMLNRAFRNGSMVHPPALFLITAEVVGSHNTCMGVAIRNRSDPKGRPSRAPAPHSYSDRGEVETDPWRVKWV